MTNMLTTQQAFKAMIFFLERHYENTSSEDIASLLGDLQLLDDETPADQAAWEDWIDAIDKAFKS